MRGSHVIIGVLFALLSASPNASRAAPQSDATTITCPGGFSLDVKRAEALLKSIRATPYGREHPITRGGTTSTMCFGEAIDVSLVTDDGVMLLASKTEAPWLAARVAHLEDHLVHPNPPSPSPPNPRACRAWADNAITKEGVAYAIELRVARELGVKTSRYDFAIDEEAPVITAFLRAHPNGSRNIEPLQSGYEERCNKSR